MGRDMRRKSVNLFGMLRFKVHQAAQPDIGIVFVLPQLDEVIALMKTSVESFKGHPGALGRSRVGPSKPPMTSPSA